MRKIIFLDIDGVLAIPNNIEEAKWGLTEECMDNLEYVLAHTNAEIVISSSWRKHTVEETKEHLKSKGFRFCDKITGVTISPYRKRLPDVHPERG